MKVEELNSYWTSIYYHLHYTHQEKITHQTIRLLQHIDKSSSVGIKEIADYLHVSHNTASEHVKRSIEKGYVYKNRDIQDERKVILHLTEAGKDILKRNSSLDEEKVSAILLEMTASEKQLIQQAFRLLSERAKHV
ncbi:MULTISPECIES: MarR family winged helix-turn-helix transcriptional regulator [Priestia]|jgi:DNA-binding MarR family transcriptional regulator|uniref:MarR family winged helix-turn-helix transcriptional regulator n=1 Tax=Priestia TaxID=2800373 RepID=UPI0013E397E1|nr:MULTISPECIES: MarR family winged helix-turn-helix transcriptional regulator [Priestia]MBU3569107.1 winged helix-turn-helix transcriptional regulator [Priestia aryabhattai]MDI3092977.1 MarR family winged helix-turn-helix transcriptional regulator [Priestia megaterium]MED3866327.1 MarR family winged helix-turn-helix transcriptional regulator [Priestia megaterium]MED4097698.1 MarR family winged helix-turn-helix transcriptional regulator [Priestia megaterium]MED4142016.1 MarR family winged heli